MKSTSDQGVSQRKSKDFIFQEESSEDQFSRQPKEIHVGPYSISYSEDEVVPRENKAVRLLANFCFQTPLTKI